ncbi:hypothetical protein NDU88_001355, partial [Pleurodeles waltl]
PTVSCPPAPSVSFPGSVRLISFSFFISSSFLGFCPLFSLSLPLCLPPPHPPRIFLCLIPSCWCFLCLSWFSPPPLALLRPSRPSPPRVSCSLRRCLEARVEFHTPRRDGEHRTPS